MELEIRPLPSFGSEVVGVDVSAFARMLSGSPEEVAEARRFGRQLRAVLHRERFLAFRGQGDIPWEHQVALTGVFGAVFNESQHSNRKRHPAVPDDHVAVFSNDPEKGATNVGVEGWHVDGNVVRVPHAATLIHAVSAIPNGDTFFVPLREVVQQLRHQGHLRGRCAERAPPCLGNVTVPTDRRVQGSLALDDVMFQSGHSSEIRHPLIYPHPVTGQDTMMFALGGLSGQYRKGCLQPSLPTSSQMTEAQTEEVISTVLAAIETSRRTLRWRWAPGDLVVVDNLAVAHLASDGTQSDPHEIGLRLMRRTTVQNFREPKKRPVLHTLPHECIQEEQRKARSFGSSQGASSPGHYCVFSLAGLLEHQPGEFESRDEARERCRTLSPNADLAMPTTPARNAAAGHVVSAVGLPHWLGGSDFPNGEVTWLDGSADAWGAEPRPWHEPSGQPNDCDGPDAPETCMFMGPHARWFDFACQPKVPTANVTAGPEITWEDGSRRMYSLFPLCGLDFYDGEAVQLGLRVDF